MKKRRILAGVLTVLAAMGLVLSGCAQTPPEPSTTQPATTTSTAPDTQEPEGLTGDFELQLFSGGWGEQVWKDALDGFQKENPDLNLIVNMGAQVNEQMNTRWLSDNPPDFVYISGSSLPMDQFIKDGKMMDLSDWYETAVSKETGKPIKDQLIDGMLEYENGGVYRAPILFNCWGVWYDNNLFEDNGVAVPGNYEELMQAGEQLKEKGIPLFCYTGVYSLYLTRGFLQPTLAAEGGAELLNKVASGEDPEVYRSEPFKKVLGKFESMVKAGYVMDGTVALDHIGSQMAWLNHQAALIPNGLWLENEMKQDIPAGFDMRFIPSVLQDASQKMVINPAGASVGIAAKAKNPEAAKAFLEYLYRDSVIKNFVEQTGTPAAVKMDVSNLNVTATTKDAVNKINDPDVQMVVQSPSNLPGPVEKAFTDAVNAIALGSITVDEACERIYEAAVNMES